MTRATITTLTVSSGYALLTIGALLYVYSTIYTATTTAATLQTTLNEHEGKEALARTIADTTAVTAAARSELASYFLREEDTISFIARLEAAAQTIGVRFAMTELTNVPPSETGPALLRTAFTVSGSKTAVMRYLTAIETLPYHSVIPTVLLVDQGDGAWQASVVLTVTIMPSTL